jgi:hypothetical protein
MKRSTELKNIIRLAQRRHATLCKKLELACLKRDDIKADRISSFLAYENELIHNATKDLETQA